MTVNTAVAHHDGHHDDDSKDIFGFWIYIMSDCILFAIIFATYAVLHNNTFGGPSAAELASIPFILTETILLLVSSFTYGLAMLARNKGDAGQVLMWLVITFVLGLSFVAMELYEFAHLIHEGNSWQRSGFLSAFFTLVGTHGLHVTMGLIWMVVMIVQVYQNGINPLMTKRLTCLGLFWHFLDVVWIFVFSIVYLMGAIS
ncbi:cytochrome o ubiquinol oxidase subunit III [Piscirickettsia salmonis]|uniref:Cytochrome bo(3) ubiquinol oxidase subunit 3 n=1 Tax=Piscirickettsia salmonis TaxID=1238 RepID=A0A9Q6LL51_PISSA|nr:cytochrome o ubiquinol oxidase subunit III [Piscirickettsia salmonis]ALA24835.1 cytochrome o ubiquinol oxidase subunit III [Piscirickettsia salmonis]APS45155.1 cytochrome o ubiquinol oxidase subunit III [Piscirickettsia salmonis]APS48515.1 cytochrome o ubiquinol oxidase subunit III [Piscirickettsia salmonis]APS49775.1 cytochrome o ubiquinol oxidase subunit III [Piscirickettsia salmonis]APS52960.1 cytochrome o ubiquinol oxidase subunit III [Piscirickettsia salmonis]